MLKATAYPRQYAIKGKLLPLIVGLAGIGMLHHEHKQRSALAELKDHIQMLEGEKKILKEKLDSAENFVEHSVSHLMNQTTKAKDDHAGVANELVKSKADQAKLKKDILELVAGAGVEGSAPP